MTASASAPVRLLRELRRRRVFRTGGLYVVGAWLVMQAADVFFPGWGLPDAAINVLLVAAILGFPLALVFGWFYDITTHGIVRTPPAGEGDTGELLALKRYDYLVLGALVLIAALIVYDAVTEILEAPRVAATSEEEPGGLEQMEKPENSIAVLPFLSISSDPENEDFCTGVSVEILNKLAAFADLHVIARTSSFAFRDSDYGIPKISRLLGVRYLLQGSVRRHGDQLRISAELVDDTGVQRWNDDFDRKLDNIFEIQTEIANAVATTVAPWITYVVESGHDPDLEAYQYFLRGREFLYRRDLPRATEMLETAVELDPDFAAAQAEYAIVLSMGAPGPDSFEGAERAIDTALRLSPGLPRALAAKGLLLQQRTPPDYPAAEKVLLEALAADPNMVDAMNWLGNPLLAQGRGAELDEWTERALRIDPLNPVIGGNLARRYQAQGELEQAERILRRLIAVPAPGNTVFIAMRDFLQGQGDLVAMNATAKQRSLLGSRHHYDLALNYALLGMWAASDYWIRRSTEEESERHQWIAYSPTLPPLWQGRYGEAAEMFERILESRGEPTEALGAVLRWWFGMLQALAGDCDGAASTLEGTLASLGVYSESNDLHYRAVHALIWACRDSDRSADLRVLLERIETIYEEERQRVRFVTSPYRYVMAQNAALLGEAELAIERLGEAIEAGWRDYYIRREDPVWGIVRDDPRFRKMMAEVRADVDRQRAEVERRDAEEDFIARLDEARGAGE